MKILKGKNVEVKVFTDLIEEDAEKQIIEMANHDITKGSQVRIMPDVHAGKGSTVGTTIKLPENFEDWKVSPNVVGVDVGCGIMMYKLNDKNIDLIKLDEVVNKFIPAGFNIHNKPQNLEFTEEALENLSFNVSGNRRERVHQSLGTLGGGNHFIELGVDENGDYWLSVHSGSRSLGLLVANTHQEIAVKRLHEKEVNLKEVIEKLKAEGRHKEIQRTIEEKIKSQSPKITKEMEPLAYIQGDDLKNYLNDMNIAQKYAAASRETMLNIIVEMMGFDVIDKFDSVHNFIEHDNFKKGIIRKGATSAKDGERLVIPLNMRDGALICVGKGNEDWNYSAPHGAGRMMSRAQARKELKLEDFKAQMEGIYSSSICETTIDEAPEAYKPAKSIIENIDPTVDILHLVKPVYNFKSH